MTFDRGGDRTALWGNGLEVRETAHPERQPIRYDADRFVTPGGNPTVNVGAITAVLPTPGDGFLVLGRGGFRTVGTTGGPPKFVTTQPNPACSTTDHNEPEHCLAVAADPKDPRRVAILRTEGTVQLWETESGTSGAREPVGQVDPADEGTYGLAFCADGRHVAVYTGRQISVRKTDDLAKPVQSWTVGEHVKLEHCDNPGSVVYGYGDDMGTHAVVRVVDEDGGQQIDLRMPAPVLA